jgi:hypothetical protein
VTTETSVYLLELDLKQVTRVPDAGAGPPPGFSPAPIASLRRDHESAPLLELITCTVGEPMRMLIDIRRDGVSTLRTTTVVRHLRKLNVESGWRCGHRKANAFRICWRSAFLNASRR